MIAISMMLDMIPTSQLKRTSEHVRMTLRTPVALHGDRVDSTWATRRCTKSAVDGRHHGSSLGTPATPFLSVDPSEIYSFALYSRTASTHPNSSLTLPCCIPLSCDKSFTTAGPGSSPPPWYLNVSFFERIVMLLIGTSAAAVPAAAISVN